ncbi:solute carrier family 35 member F2 [Mucor ambiguus]|uniref:Solute carrier family 35 member F2 n=1 Tax=Mucor ambiguus TaxID=91626 RepID=A0A0C9MGF7_9FUNG|nr:solute carrier family 35 member F2 [Mucor ambiguus]
MPKRQTVLAVGLGQLLSLCITGTSSASSALWRRYAISIPFTQNLCNYILLAIVYTTLSRKRPNSIPAPSNSGLSWQCNVLAVLAFKSTSVLSALVLSSWSIPCIMLLSTYFLNATYSKIHVQSALVCLVGLALLIWGDTIDDNEATKNHSWIGDIICLSSATLYAISNVTEEHLVKQHTSTEFLGKAGFWGSILCGFQAYYFEFEQVIEIQWSWSVLATYVLCLFCMYSLVPTVYRMVGATFLSMSLITSNFYSLIVGLLFLDAHMPPFYPIAYALVIISVTAYSLAPSPIPLKQEGDDEERRPIYATEYNYGS